MQTAPPVEAEHAAAKTPIHLFDDKEAINISRRLNFASENHDEDLEAIERMTKMIKVGFDSQDQSNQTAAKASALAIIDIYGKAICELQKSNKEKDDKISEIQKELNENLFMKEKLEIAKDTVETLEKRVEELTDEICEIAKIAVGSRNL